MADSDALKQYKAAMSAGKRFIDQVRTEVPTDTSFVKCKYLDIPYAEGSGRRKLDIYLPNEGEGPFPVIVDLYGGGWYFGEKSTYKIDLSLELLIETGNNLHKCGLTRTVQTNNANLRAVEETQIDVL